jgi:uncharacterized protein YceK
MPVRTVSPLKWLMLSVTLVAITGCATAYVRDQLNEQRKRTEFYPATVEDFHFIGWAMDGSVVDLSLLGKPSLWPLSPFFVAGALVDLPISVVLDTLALPADFTEAREKRMTRETTATISTLWPVLAAFKQANGRFPTDEEGLAVLKPTFIKDLPHDAWGTPLRYRLMSGRPLIDSAGSDKKFDTYPDVGDWYPLGKDEKPGQR